MNKNKKQLFSIPDVDLESLSDTEKMFIMKSVLLHRAGKHAALAVALLASFIAWVGLYIAEAIDSGDMVYAIFAGIGMLLFPTLTSLYYIEASSLNTQAARIEAKLYSSSLSITREN